MKVKSRSLASISRWSKGRCWGKIKGYKSRLAELARVLLIVDSFGMLTDELILSIFDAVIKIGIESRKANYRLLSLYNKRGDWGKITDDSKEFTPRGYIHDFSFYLEHFNSRRDIYERYLKLKNESKDKEIKP